MSANAIKSKEPYLMLKPNWEQITLLALHFIKELKNGKSGGKVILQYIAAFASSFLDGTESEVTERLLFIFCLHKAMNSHKFRHARTHKQKSA